jgi:hypothetical protein
MGSGIRKGRLVLLLLVILLLGAAMAVVLISNRAALWVSKIAEPFLVPILVLALLASARLASPMPSGTKDHGRELRDIGRNKRLAPTPSM